MLFYCSEQMQNRGLNTCKQDIYSFLRFSLPTNTEPSTAGDFHALRKDVQKRAECGRNKLFSYIYSTKLLQKSEMRKEIVIELSYKGFSRASDYS